MPENDSGEVIEKRDVTDLSSNEEVDEAVDEMLDGSDLEDQDTDSEPSPEIKKAMEEAETRQEESTEVTLSGSSTEEAVDDIDSFDFEGQEWTLDEKRQPEIKHVRDMKFKFAEPDNDDKVLNTLEQASDGGRGEQMKALVRLVVEAPEITDERWDGMSISAKLSLAGKAADYLDLDEGFLDE